MNIPQTQATNERQYLHTLTAGALLPFAQATILALVIFLVSWAVFAVTFNMLDPHKPALLFGALTWALMLWRLIRHWLKLTDVQNFIRDLTDDGQLNNSYQPEVEETEATPRRVRIQLDKITSDKSFSSAMITFPCGDDQLEAFALGLTSEPPLPFTERFWTSVNKTFSTDEYRAVCDVMHKHDLCEYVNPDAPKMGRALTETGKKLLREIALPHSPTAEDEA